GRPAFEGDTSEEVLRQQLYERAPRLSTLRRDLPAQVEQVLNWALEKAPANRPDSAGAFVRALNDASRGRTLGNTRVGDAYASVARGWRGVPPAPPAGAVGSLLDSTYSHNAQTVYDAGPPPRFGAFGAPPLWPGATARAYPPMPQRRRGR